MAAPQDSQPAPLPRWALHLIVLGIMFVVAAAAVIAADVYVHHRLAKYAAVNVWGYRGEVLGRKQATEKRVFVIGPSTVFGVGFPPEDALPAQLERALQQRVPFPVHVVNLGMPGEDAYAYRATIEDFRYLKPDAVIFYGDSNLTGHSAPIVLRHSSPIFRLTGYSPILHIAIAEKWLMWRTKGKIQDAYGGDKVVFRPATDTKTDQGALKGAADVAEFMTGKAAPAADAPPPDCRTEFKDFCASMDNAVTYARSLGLPALVVTQPFETDFQVLIQQALQRMLEEKHGADPAVMYLNMGRGIDLHDTTLTYDGVHLTPAGNAKMASQLVEPALALLQHSQQR